MIKRRRIDGATPPGNMEENIVFLNGIQEIPEDTNALGNALESISGNTSRAYSLPESNTKKTPLSQEDNRGHHEEDDCTLHQRGEAANVVMLPVGTQGDDSEQPAGSFHNESLGTLNQVANDSAAGANNDFEETSKYCVVAGTLGSNSVSVSSILADQDVSGAASNKDSGSARKNVENMLDTAQLNSLLPTYPLCPTHATSKPATFRSDSSLVGRKRPHEDVEREAKSSGSSPSESGDSTPFHVLTRNHASNPEENTALEVAASSDLCSIVVHRAAGSSKEWVEDCPKPKTPPDLSVSNGALRSSSVANVSNDPRAFNLDKQTSAANEPPPARSLLSSSQLTKKLDEQVLHSPTNNKQESCSDSLIARAELLDFEEKMPSVTRKLPTETFAPSSSNTQATKLPPTSIVRKSARSSTNTRVFSHPEGSKNHSSENAASIRDLRANVQLQLQTDYSPYTLPLGLEALLQSHLPMSSGGFHASPSLESQIFLNFHRNAAMYQQQMLKEPALPSIPSCLGLEDVVGGAPFGPSIDRTRVMMPLNHPVSVSSTGGGFRTNPDFNTQQEALRHLQYREQNPYLLVGQHLQSDGTNRDVKSILEQSLQLQRSRLQDEHANHFAREIYAKAPFVLDPQNPSDVNWNLNGSNIGNILLPGTNENMQELLTRASNTMHLHSKQVNADQEAQVLYGNILSQQLNRSNLLGLMHLGLTPGIPTQGIFAYPQKFYEYDNGTLHSTADNHEARLSYKPKRTKPLSLPSDVDSLSPYQCLVRGQILIFEAQEEETECGAQGRSRSISIGQVGILCRHCSNVRPESRTRGAMYFPFKIMSLYQAAQNMVNNHFLTSCHRTPIHVQANLKRLRDEHSSMIYDGKLYWAKAARHLGVEECEFGLRFGTNLLTDEVEENIKEKNDTAKNT